MEAQENLIKATHEGELHIVDQTLPCAVLEDSTRIISQNAIFRAFGRAKRGRAGGDQRVSNVPAFIDANNLQPFINNDLWDVIKPVEYLNKYNRKVTGYKAEIIPLLCDVYLTARSESILTKKQLPLAVASEIIVRSLSKLGIIALVDEATGYQEVRDRIALQKILDKYILDEFRRWTKTFPAEFYKEMFRLKKWTYDEKSIKRPSVIGHYTNNIVYKRLAPAVLKELQHKNPTTEKGFRKQRHHQWLSGNVGFPKLKDHLVGVVALMKAAPNWGNFLRLLERAYPKYGDTMPMDFEEN